MLLDIDNVVKTYAGASRAVLDGVSMSLDAGETLALTGESGSGKSTLLHVAGALDTFQSGEIRLNGTAFSGLDDRGRAALRLTEIAVVFQQFNLIPSLDVAQNIAFQAGLGGRIDADYIDTLTKKLGLDDLKARFPEHLSGGQQQRVAIGRALAARPRLLLADEPTGNLDEATGDAVLDLMLDLVSESGTALLMVTHSERVARRCARRLTLSGGRLT